MKLKVEVWIEVEDNNCIPSNSEVYGMLTGVKDGMRAKSISVKRVEAVYGARAMQARPVTG